MRLDMAGPTLSPTNDFAISALSSHARVLSSWNARSTRRGNFLHSRPFLTKNLVCDPWKMRQSYAICAFSSKIDDMRLDKAGLAFSPTIDFAISGDCSHGISKCMFFFKTIFSANFSSKISLWHRTVASKISFQNTHIAQDCCIFQGSRKCWPCHIQTPPLISPFPEIVAMPYPNACFFLNLNKQFLLHNCFDQNIHIA